MIKQFTSKLWHKRQHPLISIIGIVGTALSIFLIMLVVMLQQVKVAPFLPSQIGIVFTCTLYEYQS